MLGVGPMDVFFFWPYVDPHEVRHVLKEATSAAILSGALKRALMEINTRAARPPVQAGRPVQPAPPVQLDSPMQPSRPVQRDRPVQPKNDDGQVQSL